MCSTLLEDYTPTVETAPQRAVFKEYGLSYPDVEDRLLNK